VPQVESSSSAIPNDSKVDFSTSDVGIPEWSLIEPGFAAIQLYRWFPSILLLNAAALVF
jgi:hypothetical protein